VLLGSSTLDTDVVRRFYDAMHRLDVDALLDTLADDFVGHVSAGLPGGFGGTHRGARTMFDQVWLPVYRTFRCLPHPTEYLTVDDGRVVVIGEYRGPAGDREGFTAEFAHVWRLAGGRITGLRQITDTRAWPDVA
jgi:2-(1,2-epoxy-1,2-dihydrophenyl)acetyl-CoA isomerase